MKTTTVRACELRDGMNAVSKHFGVIRLNSVHVFRERQLPNGAHFPPCVLVFYNDRRDSHTFHYDEKVQIVTETDLALHQRETRSADASSDHSPVAEGEPG